jgi:enamine deaminase RidA (YjgF/YER057c/UK114 family)
MIRRTGPWGGILHEVVEHNGVLYLGGIVADDLELDIAGQAEDCLRQADALLAAHGSNRTRLLSALIFVADLAEKPAFDSAWKRWLDAAHLPARAAVGAGALGPGVRVEVVLTAAAGEG